MQTWTQNTPWSKCGASIRDWQLGTSDHILSGSLTNLPPENILGFFLFVCFFVLQTSRRCWLTSRMLQYYIILCTVILNKCIIVMRISKALILCWMCPQLLQSDCHHASNCSSVKKKIKKNNVTKQTILSWATSLPRLRLISWLMLVRRKQKNFLKQTSEQAGVEEKSDLEILKIVSLLWASALLNLSWRKCISPQFILMQFCCECTSIFYIHVCL